MTGLSHRAPTVVVSGLASDAHTWNLVYLQLLIEELGYRVVNLGPCVPDDVLVEQCRRLSPALIVISSVNGHGHRDGRRVVARLRACPELAAIPLVIGGQLGTDGADRARAAELVAAGFDAVFVDGAVALDGTGEGGTAVLEFRQFVRSLPAGRTLAGQGAGPAA